MCSILCSFNGRQDFFAPMICDWRSALREHKSELHATLALPRVDFVPPTVAEALERVG